MKDVFINADCGIVPYNSALRSVVIIDAYKYSRPVVAFDVVMISEQVDDGVTGFFAELGNIADLECKLRKIIDMFGERYEQMCRKSYQKGLDVYSAKSSEKEFLNAIGIDI